MYADSYTLSGCRTAAAQYCGVFHRVAAHCAGGDYCPGGASARPGWSDATLCDGAPAYQRGGAGGAVLFRRNIRGEEIRGDPTAWIVGPSDCLGDCNPFLNFYLSDIAGDIGPDEIPQPSALPPDAAGYGWSEPRGYYYAEDIGVVHIVAGDGGGGGGR